MKAIKIFVALWIIAFHSNAQQYNIDSTIGLKAPEKISKSIYGLSHFLTDNLTDDYQKVNAFYNWITHNIAYDVQALKKGNFKRYSPAEVLNRKKAMCLGYSDLLKAMCDEVGIKCEVIEGYAKDWKFDNGDHFYKPQHAWNAVLIVSKWNLVDATWGAGGLVQKPGWHKQVLQKVFKKRIYTANRLKFQYEYDPSYCFENPENFRIKHMPADPLWQLTDTLMPLSIFEKGEKEIKKFNELYSNPQPFSVALSNINKLKPNDKILESADRTLDFNPRYKIKKSEKHLAHGNKLLNDCFQETIKSEGKVLLQDAKKELAISRNFISDQKKDITAEYTALKTKNREKKKLVNEYKQKIVSTNKRFVAQANTRMSANEGKKNDIMKKYNDLRREKPAIDESKWTSIKPQGTSPQTSELKKIEDSLQQRSKSINTAVAQLNTADSEIDQLFKESKQLLNSLSTHAHASDSLLYNELLERTQMKDSYDDEIVVLQQETQKTKFEKSDTLQRQYFSSYDTMLKRYETIIKNRQQVIGMYKKNATDIEQYKKYNGTDKNILNQYKQNVNAYKEQRQQLLTTYDNYITLLNSSKPVLKSINKLYSRQNEMMKYMVRAEDARKKATKNALAKEEKIDKKVNTKNKETIKKVNTNADKIFASIHSPKKKKNKKKKETADF